MALAERVVQCVSTRKVITVRQSLLGPEVSISSNQVSRVAETLDTGLQAWRERVRAAGQIIDGAVWGRSG